jgi:hypothetical protein
MFGNCTISFAEGACRGRKRMLQLDAVAAGNPIDGFV